LYQLVIREIKKIQPYVSSSLKEVNNTMKVDRTKI